MEEAGLPPGLLASETVGGPDVGRADPDGGVSDLDRTLLHMVVHMGKAQVGAAVTRNLGLRPAASRIHRVIRCELSTTKRSLRWSIGSASQEG